MATTLFLRAEAADTHLGTNNPNLIPTNVAWTPRALATTRGAGVTASDDVATVAGTTPGVVVVSVGTPVEWISPPVSADVTISGDITANVWASESNMSANVAINVIIEIIRANVLGTNNSNTLVEIVRSTRVTEVAVTTRAVNNFTTGMLAADYTEQTLNRGDRLRIRVFGDDVGTMASGFTFNIGFSGTTGGADGDTFVTFTETFAFESAPGGSQLFLTNAHSGLSGAPALISDFTGANENPLSEGGNWANLNTATGSLQRISNAVSGSGATGPNASYWTPANFGPDLEAYIEVATVSSGAGIAFRIQGEGGSSTWDGYYVYTTGVIRRVTNAVDTTLIDLPTTFAAGDKLGVRVAGSTIQLWKQASGSSDWNLEGTAVDTTYSAAGKIGLITAADVSVRIADFYAATASNLFTQRAWTSRGAGVVSYRSDTNTGWTAPLVTQDWYTPQLSAVTLQGMAQANIRGASTDLSGRVQVAVVDSDGSNPTVWADWNMQGGTEFGATETARTVNVSGDSLAISSGQRLRIRLTIDDRAELVMAAGSHTYYFNGTSAAASGDTYITFPVTLTEFSAGAPTSLLYSPRPMIRNI